MSRGACVATIETCARKKRREAGAGFYQYRERRCPAGGCTRHIHVPRPSGGCAVQIGNPADLSNPQGHAPNHLSPPHTQNAPCGALGVCGGERGIRTPERSEEHTSELQSLMSNTYAVFCFQK